MRDITWQGRKRPWHRAPAKKKVAKGESYVREVCGCVDVCDIICCGRPMKEKTMKVKATKKRVTIATDTAAARRKRNLVALEFNKMVS